MFLFVYCRIRLLSNPTCLGFLTCLKWIYKGGPIFFLGGSYPFFRLFVNGFLSFLKAVCYGVAILCVKACC